MTYNMIMYAVMASDTEDDSYSVCEIPIRFEFDGSFTPIAIFKNEEDAINFIDEPNSITNYISLE